MTAAELQRLAEMNPLVLLAVNELKKMSEDAEFMEKYRARRDFLVQRAKESKDAIVLAQKIGIIQLCERLLQKPETPDHSLWRASVYELTDTAKRLEEEVKRQMAVQPEILVHNNSHRIELENVAPEL